VDQSIFTWFLWDRFGEKPEEGAIAVKPSQNIANDTPNLSLLPASVQRKGLVHIKDNVNVLRAIVLEAEQGISRADLIRVIQREAPQLKAAGSASNIISQAQGGLALIGLHDGAYRPTERGLELLTAPDAAQVLQPLLVGRIFGIGHLLLALKNKPDGIGQKVLSEQLSILVPTRRSLWSGGELIQWSLVTRLVSQENGKIRLTEDGAAYAEALPANFLAEWTLKPTDVELAEDENSGNEIAAREDDPKFSPAPWDILQARFADGQLSSRLILPQGFLAELHASLHATDHKRFVLLAGLSGTGKTSIAHAYAEAYCRSLNLANWEDRYAQIAVRPDWTDPTGLLGFVNAIAEPATFQGTKALQLLLAADRDRSRPYFLCLDEMNLARVEHYFAPFLSAMEGDASTLQIHSEQESIGNIEPSMPWPKNLFVFGTVNMDESTHPFSDKVLDRAFTFEFWDVDLAAWEAKARTQGNNAGILDRVAPLLNDVYSALEPARRHFGYRTADEILAYCMAGSSELSLERLIDGAILMKILPRIRGDDTGPLSAALDRLLALLDSERFPRTVKKIKQMASSLQAAGQARFWS
jgi:MoxR-like ATPase